MQAIFEKESNVECKMHEVVTEIGFKSACMKEAHFIVLIFQISVVTNDFFRIPSPFFFLSQVG